jgi:hypothetical protein
MRLARLPLRLLSIVTLSLVPTLALAGPADTRVGETRVVYAATGTPLKAEPVASGALVGSLPANTRVVVLEVKLPWVKVEGAAPGQPAIQGWLRAYQAVEPSALAGTPPPAHVDDRKAAQVSQQQAAAAGRQFTADTEQRYQGAHPDLSAAYQQVNELERLSGQIQPGDSIEFLMDGSIGRKGCDYVLPARLPPSPPPAAAARRSGGGNPLKGPLGGLLKEGLKKGGVDDRLVEGALAFANAMVEAQTAQLKKQFNHDQEYYLGRAVAAQAIARYGVEPNQELRRYVRRVGDAMVRVSSRVPANYGGYHFEVLNSDEVNGISGPGGFVLVTRGAVLACQTEDELAGVLAHELAHITRQHAEKVLRGGSKWQGAMGGFAKGVAAATGLGDERFTSGLANLFTEAEGEMGRVSADHAYGPALENDADREGTYLLHDVFYNWYALRNVLDSLAHTGHAHGGSTHASPAQRVAQLDAILPPLGLYPDRPGVVYERLLRFNGVLGRPAPTPPAEKPAAPPAAPSRRRPPFAPPPSTFRPR